MAESSTTNDYNHDVIVKFGIIILYGTIRNTHDFFYRYFNSRDAAIAALSVAPFYMWKAERKICEILSVKRVVDIERAFMQVMELYNQPRETAEIIVNEYSESFGLDHAKSQIKNQAFITGIVTVIIETILGRTSRHSLSESDRSQIVKHIENEYEHISGSALKSRWS